MRAAPRSGPQAGGTPAQKVMKNILWATENAERLQRGELLSEREDDD